MNKQTANGISWTHRYGPGTGYTWNFVTGCRHDCRWLMPDGAIASCYAKAVADGLAAAAYPGGFSNVTAHSQRLIEPLRLKTPAGIFVGSMSDMMGVAVHDDYIYAALEIMRQADWHTFFLLTKNAPRLLKFKSIIPHNVWVGVSVPPTYMHGHELTSEQQYRMYSRSLDVLAQLTVPVRWVSFEPLSRDMTGIRHLDNIEWAVIGAASRGKDTFQPARYQVEHLLDALDEVGAAVWMKENLAWEPRRQEWPTSVTKESSDGNS